MTLTHLIRIGKLVFIVVDTEFATFRLELETPRVAGSRTFVVSRTFVGSRYWIPHQSFTTNQFQHQPSIAIHLDLVEERRSLRAWRNVVNGKAKGKPLTTTKGCDDWGFPTWLQNAVSMSVADIVHRCWLKAPFQEGLINCWLMVDYDG